MTEMAHPHSPEELAELSTLIHNFAGWLFAVLAIVMLIEMLRGVPRGRARYVWPGIGAFIGVGLATYVFLHMSLYHRVSPFAVAAQVQHQLIGLAVGAGSVAELLRRWRRSEHRAWRSAFPLAVVAVGVIFLAHEQGTFDALIVHWALAGTLILAGLALLAPELAGDAAASLRAFAVLVLLGGAAQLVFFEEAPGAHGDHAGGATTQPTSPMRDDHGGH
jgi:hypothetical protein